MKWPISIVIGIVILDQITKELALRFVQPGGLFHLAFNRGITFGFFQGANWAMALVSFIAAGLLLLAILKHTSTEQIVFSVILGGVLGNGIDRIFRGAVIDFISIGTFPVFNFADCAIVGGIIAIFLLEIPSVKNRF